MSMGSTRWSIFQLFLAEKPKRPASFCLGFFIERRGHLAWQHHHDLGRFIFAIMISYCQFWVQYHFVFVEVFCQRILTVCWRDPAGGSPSRHFRQRCFAVKIPLWGSLKILSKSLTIWDFNFLFCVIIFCCCPFLAKLQVKVSFALDFFSASMEANSTWKVSPRWRPFFSYKSGTFGWLKSQKVSHLAICFDFAKSNFPAWWR